MSSNSTSDQVKFAIRPCKNKDIPSVMDINETTLPENYPFFFYEQILERYPDSFTLAYLVDDPSKIVGYVMWRVERGPSAYGLEYTKKGHLVSLAVLPEYRRIGVANAILEKSMKVVAKSKVTEYVLEVRVSNMGAVNLYRKGHQFECMKIISHYYRDGEDAFFMSSKNDEKGIFKPGQFEMTDAEITLYYAAQNTSYLCYRCPNCKQLLLKALTYALKGSIKPGNDAIYWCPECKHEMTLFDISQGKYDTEN